MEAPAEVSLPPKRLSPATPGLLGLAAALVLVLLPKGAGALGQHPDEGIPELCGAWHRGRGEGHPIDLERLARSYDGLKLGLAQGLGALQRAEEARYKLGAHDAGLPACRGEGSRRRLPALAGLPPELLGKELLFFRAEAASSPRVRELAKAAPDALLFITAIDKLENLGALSTALGRPLQLAPPGLAEALGVRCAPALLRIAANGERDLDER